MIVAAKGLRHVLGACGELGGCAFGFGVLGVRLSQMAQTCGLDQMNAEGCSCLPKQRRGDVSRDADLPSKISKSTT